MRVLELGRYNIPEKMADSWYLFSHRLTQMNTDRFKYKEVTDIILGSFYV